MSEVSDLFCNYRLIRERLLHPHNAVIDIGIDLKRKPVELPVDNLEVLDNHITANVTITELINRKPLTMRDILIVVCKYYHVTSAEIKGSLRSPYYVRPRHVFCYLAMRHCPISYPIAGRFLGGRDHTTILHAVRKIKERMTVDDELKRTIETLEKILCITPDD